MPRTPRNHLVCEFFTWNLFERDGVLYADGRRNTPKIGKHSLGTRDREQAMQNLRELDRRMAVRLKLTMPPPTSNQAPVPIAQGWERYLEFCNRPGALKGVSKNTEKRYWAVRDKHLEFCQRNGIETWNQMNKKTTAQYAAWLSKSCHGARQNQPAWGAQNRPVL